MLVATEKALTPGDPTAPHVLSSSPGLGGWGAHSPTSMLCRVPLNPAGNRQTADGGKTGDDARCQHADISGLCPRTHGTGTGPIDRGRAGPSEITRPARALRFLVIDVSESPPAEVAASFSIGRLLNLRTKGPEHGPEPWAGTEQGKGVRGRIRAELEKTVFDHKINK